MTDYLDWDSELSLEQVFAAGESFSYPQLCDAGCLYLTQLKEQNSRSALMLKTSSGTECITPNPFNLRTKVSEYGGKPFWLFGDQLFFCNQADQCLYRQIISSQGVSDPERITVEGNNDSVIMFTDLNLVDERFLLAIVEYEKPLEAESENNSAIAYLDLDKSNTSPVIVTQGADFYSNLVFDTKSNKVAWVQWDHPAMPWDNTNLYLAELVIGDDTLSLESKSQLEFGSLACFCQLLFASNGRLFFSADFSLAPQSHKDHAAYDYWNIFCYSPDTQKLQSVTQEQLEFGYPHWQYGDVRIVQFDAHQLLAIGSSPLGDTLFLIDQDTFSLKEFDQQESTIQSLASNGSGEAVVLSLAKDHASSLLVLNGDSLDSSVLVKQDSQFTDVSIAEHIEFTTSDGSRAFGFYYKPCNSAYSSFAENRPPPLIVLVHGGPTARAYGHFDIQKQFWTSRGFALFDVNHRGSTGYGRAYRDALYGKWGELDAGDIIDGIDALVRDRKADAARVCIRGKSAGGYAVLRALTEYPDTFKAGACYYGIGNLATLAESTHKFEKHYTDRLIGEKYSADSAANKSSRFYSRSPIHKVSRLNSAMIVFQGLQDKVVPPEVAQEVITVLKQAGIDHAYVEYEDEGHGFRQVKNNVDAWAQELAFYRRVLRAQ